MPYASKTDPAPHKGTYRLKKGPVISGLALSPHEWTHRFTNGTTAPTDGPVTSKVPHCVSKMDPTVSGTGPPSQNRPIASRATPPSQKWTRSVENGLTASKLDPSPQKRPLKSGPEVSKSDPPHHESTRHLKSCPTTSKMDPSPQKRPHPSRKWTGHLKNNHVASKADSLHQNGHVASNATPPSQKQLDLTHRITNGLAASKMDPIASKIIPPSRKQM
ncbi:hypothetical protein BU15DRAFT_74371 [Melanogaster broomeanus]|nr:hypothetical protein BU15DRAFT_74371 [Melanogaster broomeanus]